MQIKDIVHYKHDQVLAESDLLSIWLFYFVISAEEGHAMIPVKPVSIPQGCTKGQWLSEAKHRNHICFLLTKLK